jgi:hypothetical protein
MSTPRTRAEQVDHLFRQVHPRGRKWPRYGATATRSTRSADGTTPASGTGKAATHNGASPSRCTPEHRGGRSVRCSRRVAAAPRILGCGRCCC